MQAAAKVYRQSNVRQLSECFACFGELRPNYGDVCPVAYQAFMYESSRQRHRRRLA